MSMEETRQKDIERIKELCLLDDIFMKVVLKDNIPGVQDIVRVLLKRDDIDVTEVRVQDEWNNLVGHSVRLDVTAEDSEKKRYNIEVQRASEGANAKRARYNLGALDWHTLPAGADYAVLPEAFIIFITETDVLGHGLPLYTVNRFVEETGEKFPDSAHILYANASYRGDDPIGKLMSDFCEKDPGKMNYRSLAEPAGFYKNIEGGKVSMSQIMDELRAEGVAMGIRQGRAEGRAEGRAAMIRALLLDNFEEDLLLGKQFKSLQITEKEINDAKKTLRS